MKDISVHGATDRQHAIAVGVKHGVPLVQRGYLSNFLISRNTGTLTWMALPLKTSTVRGTPHSLPRYLQLELSRHVPRNIARFRLRES